MIPNLIPQEPGVLSVLIHAGKFTTKCTKLFTLKNGLIAPISGTIGTNDPDVWRHIIWWHGKAYEAVLKSDIQGYGITFDLLKDHFDQHPQAWTPVAPVGKIS